MEQSVERHYQSGRKDLYIFFGGISAGIHIPPFEFFRASNILDDHRLFVRDFDQTWYHTGLRGISTDILSTATFLRQEIAELKPRRTVFIGNSMGGFAAMAFSSMLEQGRVIVFSPQTFISPTLRFVHADKRWPDQIRKTYIKSLTKKKIWNLKTCLIKKPRNRVDIYYGKNDRLDAIHAHHLSGLPDVSIRAIESKDHNIVKLLRDSGQLELIIHD